MCSIVLSTIDVALSPVSLIFSCVLIREPGDKADIDALHCWNVSILDT